MRCRLIPRTFEFFPLADGRILLASEPPRVLDPVAFAESFEVLPDTGVTPRRPSTRFPAGRRAAVGRKARRIASRLAAAQGRTR